MNSLKNNDFNQRKKRIIVTIEIVRTQLSVGLSIKDIALWNCISRRVVANIDVKIQLGIPDGTMI